MIISLVSIEQRSSAMQINFKIIFPFLGCVLHGMDHYGDDLKRVSADNYVECGDKCLHNNQCKRWTFKPFTAFPESKSRNISHGMCILNHGKKYSLKKCGNCVSGFKKTNHQSECSMNGTSLN